MVEVPRDVVDLDIGDRLDYQPVRPTRLGRDPRRRRGGGEAAAGGAACPMILAGQGVLYAEASDELVRARRTAAGAGDDDAWTARARFPRITRWRSDQAATRSPARAGISCTRTPTWCWRSAAASLGTARPRRRCRLAMRIIHATNDARDLHKSLRRPRWRCSATRKLTIGAADRGGEGSAGRQVALGPLPGSRDRGSSGRRGSPAGRPSWDSNEAPINPYRVMAEFMRVVDPAERHRDA